MEKRNFTPEDELSWEFKKEQISEKDKEVMRKGLEVLDRFFDQLDLENYPTKIIFPDSSARPLYYLVKDLIKKKYLTAKLQPPSIEFLSVVGSRNLSASIFYNFDMVLDERVSELQQEIEYMRSDLESSDDPGGIRFEIEAREDILRKPNLDLDDVLQARTSLYARLSEITPSSSDRLLVIDDYVRTGSTFECIDLALENIRSGRTSNITYFSFYEANPDASHGFDKGNYIYMELRAMKKIQDLIIQAFRTKPFLCHLTKRNGSKTNKKTKDILA